MILPFFWTRRKWLQAPLPLLVNRHAGFYDSDFHQELKPEECFIGFFNNDSELRNEFRLGTSQSVKTATSLVESCFVVMQNFGNA
jgi:hypothetical protein